MTSCAIDGALVLFDDGFAVGTVLVEDRKIVAVERSSEQRQALRSRAGTVVAAEGHWLIPGLIDAHAHAYAAVLRGTENSLPLFVVVWGLRSV